MFTCTWIESLTIATYNWQLPTITGNCILQAVTATDKTYNGNFHLKLAITTQKWQLTLTTGNCHLQEAIFTHNIYNLERVIAT